MPGPSAESAAPPPATGRPGRFLAWAAIVLLLAAALSAYLLRTAPVTVPQAGTEELKRVKTRPVHSGDHPIRVVGYGQVIPAREVTLKSEVSGRVVRQHPGLVPGGHVPEGEEILGIDEADYQITLSEHRAALAEVESDLRLEEGRQVVAEREWAQLREELPGVEVNRDLVLRVPHRQKLEAALERARTLISRAELDLERTSLRAPFRALVLEESVEPGQLIHAGDPVAKLAGADAFWVQASIRQDELPRIRYATEGAAGAPARITLETGMAGEVYRGEVLRLLSDLDPHGRNARLIVRVDDPLGLLPGGASEDPALPLLLGSFVRVEIDAGTLSGAIALDRSLFHEGQIWVVDREQTLQIRQGRVMWRQGDTVYIADTLEPGDEVVVSSLKSVVPGTPVRAESESR